MKTLKNFLATFVMVLALSSFTFAGQIDAPPVTPPPPPPPSMSDDAGRGAAVIPSTTEGATADPFMEMTLSLLQTFLSIF